jgi:hypothetical protein
VIDPFTLYDNIPQPKYLEMTNSDDLIRSFESDQSNPRSKKKRPYDQDEEEESSIEFRKSDDYYDALRQKRKRCCGLIKGESPYFKMPNRHESLFLFGRAGQAFANTSL